ITCKYPSGLTTTTTLLPHDERLLLPSVTRRRIVVNDSYGRGIIGAKATVQGVASRYAWTTAVITGINGFADIEFPDKTTGSSFVHVEANGFGSHRDQVDFSSGRDVQFALEAAATIVAAISNHDTPRSMVARLVRVTTT